MEYLFSFAQDREDIVLYHALKEAVGNDEYFWIDVGANDPVELSVTKFFSARGGRGINIEPQPMYMEKYKEDRPNDITLNIGISDAPGELVLHGDGALASFNNANSEEKRREEKRRFLSGH